MSSYQIEPISYQLGMINTFIEMVACGVKPLALSPPIEPGDLPVLQRASEELSAGFGTRCYLELSLMLTDLQSEEFTRGKHTLIYYKDPALLERYLALKAESEELLSAGEYRGERRREISIAFGRLLGYPMEVILEKVDAEQPIDPIILSKGD